MKRAILLSLAMMIGLSTAASAQEFYETKGPAYWTKIARQTMASLHSPVEGVRVGSLKNAIYFATFYPDRIDFSAAVEPLIALCDDDGRRAEHLVALAALQAIGGDEAERYLARRSARERADIRREVLAVLSDHYQRPQTIL